MKANDRAETFWDSPVRRGLPRQCTEKKCCFKRRVSGCLWWTCMPQSIASDGAESCGLPRSDEVTLTLLLVCVADFKNETIDS